MACLSEVTRTLLVAFQFVVVLILLNEEVAVAVVLGGATYWQAFGVLAFPATFRTVQSRVFASIAGLASVVNNSVVSPGESLVRHFMIVTPVVNKKVDRYATENITR